MTCRSRYDEMLEAARRFHVEHPEVWDLFQRFTFDRIDRGFKHYSVNAIFERIRWETDRGGNGTVEFKLNNNYRPFYARAFHAKYPEWGEFFRVRIQTSKYGPATGLPELTPKDYGLGDDHG